MKPGWQTTEFWLTLVPQVMAILVILGILNPDEGNSISTQFGEVVALGGPFALALGSLVAYIWGRTKVKSDFGKTNVTELSAVLESDGEKVEFHHQ